MDAEWGRPQGTAGKFHVVEDGEDEGSAVRLCTGAAIEDPSTWEFAEGDPEEGEACGNCSKKLAAMATDAVPKDGEDGQDDEAEVAPPRNTDPDLVEVGDDVMFQFMGNGPRTVTGAAKVTKVGKDRLLDLHVPAHSGYPATDHAAVPFKVTEDQALPRWCF